MLQLADRRTNWIFKIDLEFLTHNLQWRYRLFTKMHYQRMFCDKISPGVHFHTLFEGLRMVYTGVLQAKNKKDAKAWKEEEREAIFPPCGANWTLPTSTAWLHLSNMMKQQGHRLSSFSMLFFAFWASRGQKQDQREKLLGHAPAWVAERKFEGNLFASYLQINASST